MLVIVEVVLWVVTAVVVRERCRLPMVTDWAIVQALIIGARVAPSNTSQISNDCALIAAEPKSWMLCYSTMPTKRGKHIHDGTVA